ncbi:hypothetical protein [Desulfovibrio falkowii]|uniref:Uncharacterized protein n=1 Tax=Desulfovibrio falkowii TaxID=3136602 RepID=A0ABQ0E7Y9_9BACT
MSALHFIAAINMFPLPDAIRWGFVEFLSDSSQRIDGEDKWLLVKPDEYQEWMEKMRYALDGFAELIGDPTWAEKNFQWLENKIHIPWDALPDETATTIFHTLPEHLQGILKDFRVYDEERDICFLPPLLSSEIQNQLLQGWRRYVSQTESALAEMQEENLKNARLLEAERKSLQSIQSVNTTLQQRVDTIAADNEQLKLTAQALEAQNNKLISELSAMHASRSWRTTAPLRSLTALFR